jgi:phospholipid/cholesterol/gamma-HCH transport system substrate-binding protein
MAGRNTEIRVGIAVLLALVVVVWGVTWLSDFRLAQRRHTYVVRFPDVGGLSEGDPVRVNGVQRGKVLTIDLTERGVFANLSLERSVRLMHGSSVSVRNTGLMGEKFIAVDLGEGGPRYSTRDTIPGRYESGVPEVISQMGEALRSLNRVSDEIDRILVLVEERGTLRRTLRNVEEASASVVRTVDDNSADLRQVSENLREVSSQLRSMVTEKGPVVESTVDRLAGTSTRVDSLVTRLDGVARQFSDVAGRFQTDSTTVGRLLSDKALYEDMRRTLREVSLLVRDSWTSPAGGVGADGSGDADGPGDAVLRGLYSRIRSEG